MSPAEEKTTMPSETLAEQSKGQSSPRFPVLGEAASLLGQVKEPEAVPTTEAVAPGPTVPAPVEKEAEPATPEVSLPGVEAEKPGSLEEVIEEFNRKTDEELARLAVPKRERDRTQLEKLIAARNKIRRAIRGPQEIAQLIEEKEWEMAVLEDLRPKERPDEEEISEAEARKKEIIKQAIDPSIDGLREEKGKLEERLGQARQEEADLIGTTKRFRETQVAYGSYQRLIEQERERLWEKAQADRAERHKLREQYNQAEQETQAYSQRLTVWQDYLEDQEEIKAEEESLKNGIAVMDEKVEQAGDKKTREVLVGVRASDKRRLTLLRKKRIPGDLEFEGEPKGEIERMYWEAVEEMKGIKEGKVEKVENVEEVEAGQQVGEGVEKSRGFVRKMLTEPEEFDPLSLADNLAVIASEGELGEEDKALVEAIQTEFTPEDVNRLLKELKARLSFFLKVPDIKERGGKILTFVRILEEFSLAEQVSQFLQKIRDELEKET